MLLDPFLDSRTVFRTEEAEEYAASRGLQVSRVRGWMLPYCIRKGRIRAVRRGLYIVVPPGQDPEEATVDPYVLAAHQAPDAVVAYESALAVLGVPVTNGNTIYCCSRAKLGPVQFAGKRFVLVPPPSGLRRRDEDHAGTRVLHRRDGTIRVATIERAICDLATRPELAGGWRKLLDLIDKVPRLSPSRVLGYLHVLGNRTTAAKMGYLLTKFQRRWGVQPDDLDAIRDVCPKEVHYIDRNHRRNGHVFGGFNLAVPAWMLDWHPSDG